MNANNDGLLAIAEAIRELARATERAAEAIERLDLLVPAIEGLDCGPHFVDGKS